MSKEYIKEVIKRLIIGMTVIALILIFCQLLSPNNIGTETAEVIIINEECTPYVYLPSLSFMLVYNSANRHFNITVERDGKQYTIDDHSTYNKYKDRIGDTVTARFKNIVYEDGSVEKVIIALE